VVWTWNEPGGGAGISEQKLVMYRSMGRVMAFLEEFSGVSLERRWSWVRYSRNATR
jgi:hypothetical protein